MSTECIFCKIVAGQMPASRVYEDGDAVAFMDIGPVRKGHTLVIPKGHYDQLMNTPLPVLQKLIAVVQKIARAQIAGLSAVAINVTQANGPVAGQVVPHIHFHVIPRYEGDPVNKNWQPGKYDGPEEMNRFAQKIRKALA